MGLKFTVILLFAIVLPLPALCGVVSGKTVYEGMGIEEARVTAMKDGVEVARGFSGYHGTFRLTLPPGTYDLIGVGSLPGEGGSYVLKGALLSVTVSGERVDRLVIELRKVSPLP